MMNGKDQWKEVKKMIECAMKENLDGSSIEKLERELSKAEIRMLLVPYGSREYFEQQKNAKVINYKICQKLACYCR